MTPVWWQPDGPIRQRLGTLVAVLSWLIGLLASPAAGQRIQVPAGSPAYAAPAAAPPAAFGVPAPNFNPYTVGPATPVYGTPLVPPPGSSLPYTYTPPATAAPAWGAPAIGAPSAPAYDYAAPPANSGISGDGGGLAWQPGTYGFQQNDGATTRFRQLLARLRVEHTLLLGDNTNDALGLNRTEMASTFAVPVGGTLESPLLITPGFAFNWFDGPEADPTAMARGPDLPPRTYDAYVDFGWHPKWTPEFGAELGFRTGVWTDFEEFNGDSLRFLGRGLGVVSLSPQFEVLLGAVYLDRLRVKMLPAGGVRWRPSPDWDLYLVFPNPKVRKRWFSSGSADWWWYVAGEYGGGSWTAERADLGDRFDYNDIRAVLGVEWQTPTQATGHLEIGYVFDRELIFDSQNPSRGKLDDAVMFRAGIGF